MSEKKKKIRFIVNCTVNDHRKGTPAEESYKKGRTYNLPEASADRWVRRGKAVYPEAAAKAKDANPKGGKGGKSADKTRRPQTRAEQAAAAVTNS